MSPIVFLWLGSSAHAQEAAPPPAELTDGTSAELEELRTRLRVLEQQLDEVRQAEPEVPTEIPLDLETRLDGFAAVSISADEQRPPGFALDELVLRFNANLDRAMTFSSEVAYEPAETNVALDIETIEIKLRVSDGFRLVVGRTHFPLSWWASNAFHGAYRYLPTSTPEILALEDQGGSWLPMHLVGVYATGAVPIGHWTGNYVVGIANGRSPYVGGVAQAGDWSFGKASYLRLWLDSPGGLTLGVGAYYDLVDPGLAPPDLVSSLPLLDEQVAEGIGVAQVLYNGRIELKAEGFAIFHDGEATTGGYALLGVPFADLTPYVMVDTISVDPEDPIYSLVTEARDRHKASVGLRYDIGLRLALKLQGDGILEYDAAAVEQRRGYGVVVQLAAGF